MYILVAATAPALACPEGFVDITPDAPLPTCVPAASTSPLGIGLPQPIHPFLIPGGYIPPISYLPPRYWWSDADDTWKLTGLGFLLGGPPGAVGLPLGYYIAGNPPCSD